jgi:hypothetical protein
MNNQKDLDTTHLLKSTTEAKCCSENFIKIYNMLGVSHRTVGIYQFCTSEL